LSFRNKQNNAIVQWFSTEQQQPGSYTYIRSNGGSYCPWLTLDDQYHWHNVISSHHV